MKKELTQTDIINWWLKKFHNTSIEEVTKKHNWNENDSREFYEVYSVTEEQYKEFEDYFYNEVPKLLKISKKRWKRDSWLAYLNTAPQGA